VIPQQPFRLLIRTDHTARASPSSIFRSSLGWRYKGVLVLPLPFGKPEERQFKVGAPNGYKAEEREQHRIDNCKVLKSGLVGLFQAIKHDYGHNHREKKHRYQELKDDHEAVEKIWPRRTISWGEKLYWNRFSR
jgi:hypothetical protein